MKDLDDYLNEPPDPGWCEDHANHVPCAACRADAADRMLDSRKDDRDE
jgi:hypothetical protein